MAKATITNAQRILCLHYIKYVYAKITSVSMYLLYNRNHRYQVSTLMRWHFHRVIRIHLYTHKGTYNKTTKARNMCNSATKHKEKPKHFPSTSVILIDYQYNSPLFFTRMLIFFMNHEYYCSFNVRRVWRHQRVNHNP